MVITVSAVVEVFDQLIAGKRSREEAEAWADDIRRLEDLRDLVYEPKRDEEKIWEAVELLSAAALKLDPDTFFYSMDDIADWHKGLIQPEDR